MSFVCPNNCCKLDIEPYTEQDETFDNVHRNFRKAGVVLYDPSTKKVLLVQSRGHLWGPPKGTLNYGESRRECAVREVKEETGLVVHADDFTKAVNLSNRAVYFYIETAEVEVHVQSHIVGNDANGVGWISLDCLNQCIKNGNIALSKHCQIVFKRLFSVEFDRSDFTVVKNKH